MAKQGRFRMRIPFWLIVFPFLLFSSLLAGTQLNEDSISDDERNTVKHLVADGKHLTLGETIASLRTSSPEHVPAWYLQLALWSDIIGLNFVVLRAFSWLYFVISLALMYVSAVSCLTNGIPFTQLALSPCPACTSFTVTRFACIAQLSR